MEENKDSNNEIFKRKFNNLNKISHQNELGKINKNKRDYSFLRRNNIIIDNKKDKNTINRELERNKSAINNNRKNNTNQNLNQNKNLIFPTITDNIQNNIENNKNKINNFNNINLIKENSEQKQNNIRFLKKIF